MLSLNDMISMYKNGRFTPDDIAYYFGDIDSFVRVVFDGIEILTKEWYDEGYEEGYAYAIED